MRNAIGPEIEAMIMGVSVEGSSCSNDMRRCCRTPVLEQRPAQGNAIGQAIGGGEADILDPAAGLQGSEESLDFPAQRIPFELVHGLRMTFHRQVRDQFPEDGRAPFRRIKLLGMDDLKGLVLVFPLLADRRADGHRSMPDCQHRAMGLTLRIPEPDLMGAAGLDLSHHPGDGRIAVLCQAVDATAHQKASPEFFGQTVEFVNIAFPVADMHAALGRTSPFGRQA